MFFHTVPFGTAGDEAGISIGFKAVLAQFNGHGRDRQDISARHEGPQSGQKFTDIEPSRKFDSCVFGTVYAGI